MSPDGSLAIGGFSDSSIRLWDLTRSEDDEDEREERDGDGVGSVFPPLIQRPLASLPSRSSPVTSASTAPPRCVQLLGHSGSVYGLSLSPDATFLLSSSEDASIRLWHLPTAHNVVAYRGHSFPVWDVAFSPLGYHFASAAQSAAPQPPPSRCTG